MTIKTSGAGRSLLTIAVLSVLAAVPLAAQQQKFASLGNFQLEADLSPIAIFGFSLWTLCLAISIAERRQFSVPSVLSFLARPGPNSTFLI